MDPFHPVKSTPGVDDDDEIPPTVRKITWPEESESTVHGVLIPTAEFRVTSRPDGFYWLNGRSRAQEIQMTSWCAQEAIRIGNAWLDRVK